MCPSSGETLHGDDHLSAYRKVLDSYYPKNEIMCKSFVYSTYTRSQYMDDILFNSKFILLNSAIQCLTFCRGHICGLWCSRYVEILLLGRSEDPILVGASFYIPIHISPEAQPGSYKRSTGPFPVTK